MNKIVRKVFLIIMAMFLVISLNNMLITYNNTVNSATNSGIIQMQNLKAASGNGFVNGLSFDASQKNIKPFNCYDTPHYSASDNSTVYLLKGNYKNIKGSLATIDNGSYNEFKIYGDGQLLVNEYRQGGDDPKAISIDVSNINKIEILAARDVRFFNVSITSGTINYNSANIPINKITAYSGLGFMGYNRAENFAQKQVTMFNCFNTIHYSASDNSTVYLLKGKYKTINGKVATLDNGSYNEFKIYGDGQLLVNEYRNAGDDPKTISIDVSNVNKIEILAGRDVRFFNVSIARGTISYSNNKVPINKIAAYSGLGFMSYNRTESFGQKQVTMFNCFNTIHYSASDNSTIYLLKQKYKSIKGKVGVIDNGSYNEFKIYGDGKLLANMSPSDGTSPKEILINVSGVNKLEILAGRDVRFFDVTLAKK